MINFGLQTSSFLIYYLCSFLIYYCRTKPSDGEELEGFHLVSIRKDGLIVLWFLSSRSSCKTLCNCKSQKRLGGMGRTGWWENGEQLFKQSECFLASGSWLIIRTNSDHAHFKHLNGQYFSKCFVSFMQKHGLIRHDLQRQLRIIIILNL